VRYDEAIQRHADSAAVDEHGDAWTGSGELDDLYARWLDLAREALAAGRPS
jgi:hypothetical protein